MSLANILGPLDGAEIEGGCDTCNAYQTIRLISARVWQITVHHDHDCPTWVSIQARNPR